MRSEITTSIRMCLICIDLLDNVKCVATLRPARLSPGLDARKSRKLKSAWMFYDETKVRPWHWQEKLELVEYPERDNVVDNARLRLRLFLRANRTLVMQFSILTQKRVECCRATANEQLRFRYQRLEGSFEYFWLICAYQQNTESALAKLPHLIDGRRMV